MEFAETTATVGVKCTGGGREGAVEELFHIKILTFGSLTQERISGIGAPCSVPFTIQSCI